MEKLGKRSSGTNVPIGTEQNAYLFVSDYLAEACGSRTHRVVENAQLLILLGRCKGCKGLSEGPCTILYKIHRSVLYIGRR